MGAIGDVRTALTWTSYTCFDVHLCISHLNIIRTRTVSFDDERDVILCLLYYMRKTESCWFLFLFASPSRGPGGEANRVAHLQFAKKLFKNFLVLVRLRRGAGAGADGATGEIKFCRTIS